jgi:hypothetical protein
VRDGRGLRAVLPAHPGARQRLHRARAGRRCGSSPRAPSAASRA